MGGKEVAYELQHRPGLAVDIASTNSLIGHFINSFGYPNLKAKNTLLGLGCSVESSRQRTSTINNMISVINRFSHLFNNILICNLQNELKVSK